MPLRFARWFPLVTLWTWGGIFLYFYGSGRLQSFLHPSFRPLVLGTGVGLVLTGFLLACDKASQLPVPPTSDLPDPSASCLDGCARTHVAPTAGGWLKSLVMLVPLLGAVVISPDSFDAALVRKRNVSPNTFLAPPITTASDAQVPAAAFPLEIVGNNDNKSEYLKSDDAGHIKAELVDFRYAAQSPDLRRDFDHKLLEVTGQFLPTPGANLGHFTLTRLFVICCAADAQPINVSVEAESTALMPSNLPEMTWIRVAGTVRFEHTDQMVATPIITAKEVRTIPVPEEKYLY